MRKINFCLVLITLTSLNLPAYAIDSSDSLFIGRKCKIILYYGFEAEGIITKVNPDTIWLKTDEMEYKIPVSHIKRVTDTETELSELEREMFPEKLTRIDITDECDIYLSGGSLIKDAKLMLESDTILITIKGQKQKVIKIADVRKIVFKPIAPFGKGFIIGAGIGFVSGFISIFAFAERGGHPDISVLLGGGLIIGLVLALPCGVIGGVIGAIASKSDVYYFDKGISSAKLKRVKYIIKKHSE